MLVADEFLQVWHQVGERVFVCGAILWSAEVAHEDDRSAIGEDFLDGGDGCLHAGIIGYLELVVERHIEVYTHQGFFATKVESAELGHMGGLKKKPGRVAAGLKVLNGLFGDQLGEVVHRSHELTHIAHFIVVPAYCTNQLVVANGLYFGLGSVKK